MSDGCATWSYRGVSDGCATWSYRGVSDGCATWSYRRVSDGCATWSYRGVSDGCATWSYRGVSDVNCFSVWVQTGSVGTMHALLKFLGDNNVPICGYNIGPIYKSEIMKIGNSNSIITLILNFGAFITPEAGKYALDHGVKIESSPIIYRLLDIYHKYQLKHDELVKDKYNVERQAAIYPCVLEIVSGCVFRSSDPIVIGVKVIEGTLRKGTPICTFVHKSNTEVCIEIGKVSQLKTEQGDSTDSAEKGTTLSVEIKSRKKVGTHFTETDRLYSKISRHSINLLKKHFKKSLNKSHVNTIILLKKKLNIL